MLFSSAASEKQFFLLYSIDLRHFYGMRDISVNIWRRENLRISRIFLSTRAFWGGMENGKELSLSSMRKPREPQMFPSTSSIEKKILIYQDRSSAFEFSKSGETGWRVKLKVFQEDFSSKPTNLIYQMHHPQFPIVTCFKSKRFSPEEMLHKPPSS